MTSGDTVNERVPSNGCWGDLCSLIADWLDRVQLSQKLCGTNRVLRAREVVALALCAIHLAQGLVLVFGLDALGDHGEPQCPPESHQRLADDPRFAVVL